MPTNNTGNQEFTNNADGFVIAGGDTNKRAFTVSGGNVGLVGNATGSTSFFQNFTNFQYVTYQDANGLTAVSNFASDYATFTTTGGTTSLSLSSKRFNYFTGTSTHIVVLPDATSIAVGHTFVVKNLSSQPLTIRYFDNTTFLYLLNRDNTIELRCTDVTTTNGIWDIELSSNQFDLETTATSLGARCVASWIPQGGTSTTVDLHGTAALTTQGTATAAAFATTDVRTRGKRVEYLVSPAATTAIAGFRGPSNQWTVGGGGANLGGFLFKCRWGNATGGTNTSNKAMVGMSGVATATPSADTGNISAQINMVCMGWDSTDTNIQIMYNGASGTAVKIDLGANFPVPVTDRSAPYDVTFYSPHSTSASMVYYLVKHLGTNAVATGVITNSARLPLTTVLLAPRCYMSAGGVSSLIGITLFNLYVESEY